MVERHTIHEELVTKAYCSELHTSLRRSLSVLFILCGLFMTAVVWAVYAGYSAQVRAMEVEGKFGVHDAVQVSTDKHIREALENIQADVKEIKVDLKQHVDK